MNLPIKIAANTLVQILGRIVTSGITFFIIILLARQFGVGGFGDFIKITSFVTFFYLVGDFGFNAIFLRDEKEQDFPKLLGLRLFFAGLLIILVIVIPFFLPFNNELTQGFTPFVRAGIIIYSFTLLTQAIFTTANVVFQKRLRYDLSVLAACLGQFIALVFVLLFLVLKSSLLLIILAFLIGAVASAAVSASLIKRKIKNIKPRFDWQFIKRLTLRTFPLGGMLVFNLVYFRADSFLLTLMRPTQEVGIYGLAFKFFEFPLAIPAFFGNAIYPVLLKNKKNPFGRVIFLSSLFLLISSVIIILFLWFAAPLITLVKEDFLLSVLPFRILILSLPFFFLSSLFQWELVARGCQKILALIYFSSMILNISLNILFIPRYSYIASSIITGASEIVVFILTLIVIFRSSQKGRGEAKILT